MKNAAIAVFASIALHAALAAAIAVGLCGIAEPVVIPSLDPSRVELSFAEREDVAAPAADSSPAPSSRPALEAQAQARRVAAGEPPKAESLPPSEPPEPAELALPEPDLATATMCMPEQSAAAPRQAQVSEPPKPLACIRPEYPARARRRGEQGRVVLEVAVGADGSVDDVRVASSCGFADLDAAAVNAAARARFVPGADGGRPVAMTVRLPIEFRLK